MGLKLGTADDLPLTSRQARAVHRLINEVSSQPVQFGYFRSWGNELKLEEDPTVKNRLNLTNGCGMIMNCIIEEPTFSFVDIAEPGTYDAYVEVNLENTPATVDFGIVPTGTTLQQDDLIVEANGIYQYKMGTVAFNGSDITSITNTMPELRVKIPHDITITGNPKDGFIISQIVNDTVEKATIPKLDINYNYIKVLEDDALYMKEGQNVTGLPPLEGDDYYILTFAGYQPLFNKVDTFDVRSVVLENISGIFRTNAEVIATNGLSNANSFCIKSFNVNSGSTFTLLGRTPEDAPNTQQCVLHEIYYVTKNSSFVSKLSGETKDKNRKYEPNLEVTDVSSNWTIE